MSLFRHGFVLFMQFVEELGMDAAHILAWANMKAALDPPPRTHSRGRYDHCVCA